MRRKALTTGYAEWDELQRVQLGNRLVPSRIDVTFPSTADKWPGVSFVIEMRQGVPVCTEFTVRAHAEGREVRGLDLRAVKLEEWVENIVAELAVVSEHTETEGNFKVSGSKLSEVEFQANRKTVRYARQGARRKITDEMLQQVADIYRAHLADRPVEAVQSAFGTSYRTAARYVELARARALLGPTTPGKAQG